MHGLQPGLLLVGQLLMRDDQEVDVAEDIGITGRKRPVKVRSAEVLAKDRARTPEQLGEDAVQLRKDRRARDARTARHVNGYAGPR
jgi:hypothetical protein